MDKAERDLMILEKILFGPLPEESEDGTKLIKILTGTYELLKDNTRNMLYYQNMLSQGMAYPYVNTTENTGICEKKRQSMFSEKEYVTYINSNPFLNCCIKLVRIIRYYNYSDEPIDKAVYEVEVKTQTESFIKKVSSTEICKLGWLRSIGSVAFFDTEHKRYFESFIEEKIRNFSGATLKIYTRPGWKKEESIGWKYAESKGLIGHKDSNVAVNCDWKLKIIDDFQAQKYNDDSVVEAMCKLTHANDTARVVFLYSMMSLLATFYEEAEVPIKFMTAVIGASGTRKTSLSEAITQSMWDDPKNARKCNFQASVAGLEAVINRCADSVALIDDYRPLCDKKAKQNQNEVFEMACRMFGDATGKKRNLDFMGNSDKSAVDYKARGGGVMTGEKMNREIQSSVARILICYLENDSVDTTVLTWLQENSLAYAAFVYKFLVYATKNAENIIQYLHTNVKALRSEFSEGALDAGNNRYAEYYAQLVCVKNLLVDFLKVSETFSNKGEIPALDGEFTNAIQVCLKRNIHEVTPIDICRQVLDALAWGIETKAVKVENLEEAVCSSEAIVYLTDNHAFILTSGLYHMVELYSKYTNIKIDVEDTDDVASVLLNNGVLTLGKESGKPVWSMKRPIRKCSDGRRFVKFEKSLLFPEESWCPNE